MPARPIIHIDESKCTGCGQCIVSCAEGALAIVDGKARIIRDSLCDGLGACLGHCPEGALTLIEREAEPFDEAAALAHGQHHPEPLPCGCPGSQATILSPHRSVPQSGEALTSALSHWPIKLRLIPATAPFLQGARLLLLADCAGAAAPNLHSQLLPGRTVAMTCPKFEDKGATRAKLQEILGHGSLCEIHVVEMEVPCCSALSHIVAEVLGGLRQNIPATRTILARDGRILRQESLEPRRGL
jgi:Pyruvate/2-oxoacid:ferredoxin oxidoreductase delta subunit